MYSWTFNRKSPMYGCEYARPSDDDRHVSEAESLLSLELCACQTWLTIIIIKHWMYIIGESMYISRPSEDWQYHKTVSASYRWEVRTCRCRLTMNVIIWTDMVTRA
jgi:hypothetical protein